MKPAAFYSLLSIGVLLVIGVVWWGTQTHHKSSQLSARVATSTEPTNTPSLTGLSIYTNGSYGFSVFYPSAMKVSKTFDSSYFLPTSWRVGALPNATGTPIIAIIGYHITNANSFPRYFETEVRVGASADSHELAACEKVGDGESALPDKVINGVTWKAFSFQNVGMMQYLQAVSYRTIHDNTCYALEAIETGSSYRDDTPSAADIPQSTLDQHYAQLTAIIQSFSFARP